MSSERVCQLLEGSSGILVVEYAFCGAVLDGHRQHTQSLETSREPRRSARVCFKWEERAVVNYTTPTPMDIHPTYEPLLTVRAIFCIKMSQ